VINNEMATLLLSLILKRNLLLEHYRNRKLWNLIY